MSSTLVSPAKRPLSTGFAAPPSLGRMPVAPSHPRPRMGSAYGLAFHQTRASLVAPRPAPAPSEPLSSNAHKALRALIQADMQMAYGREASEQDYAYWIGKFLGPIDSELVSSGQLSSLEYWHRRLLGWRPESAGAVALGGPYAGGREATGPVPSANDVLTRLFGARREAAAR